MSSRYETIPSTQETSESGPLHGNLSAPQGPRRIRYNAIFVLVGIIFLGAFGLLSSFHGSSGLPDHFEDASYEDGSDQNVPLSAKQQKSVTKQAKKGLKRLLTGGPTDAPLMCRVDVMILRHCERGDVLAHCTHEGFERAKYLATQFGDGEERWPTPDFLVARSPEGKKMVEREIETLVPLSEKSGVRINAEGNEIKNKLDLVDDIFAHIRSGAACNTLTVISWKHENIPKLARKLGCGPKQGCPERYPADHFDDIWNIRYMYAEPEFPTKKMRKPKKVQPTWTVSGFVLEENFDIIEWDKKNAALGINSGEYSEDYLPGNREPMPQDKSAVSGEMVPEVERDVDGVEDEIGNFKSSLHGSRFARKGSR